MDRGISDSAKGGNAGRRMTRRRRTAMSEATAMLLVEAINNIELSLNRMIFVLILFVVEKLIKTLLEIGLQ